MSITPNLDPPPTFGEYFTGLFYEKKQQIHKASDYDAFVAAESEVVQKHGFKPDFGFDAFRKRKNAQIKGKNAQTLG